jgi:hypothetical protein
VKLDWKLVSAFATGVGLACGIVYFSVKPAVIVPEPVRQPAPAPKLAARQPVPAPKAPIPPGPPVKVATRVHVPIREKPSPMPPPARHENLAIARYEPPPVFQAAAPKPAENIPAENVALPAQPPVQPKEETHAAPRVTLSAGSLLFVRLDQGLSSALNRPGDSFEATLTQPLVVDDWVIAERDAHVEGRVTDIAQSAQAAHLEISIVHVALSDGQRVSVHTEAYVRDGRPAFGIFVRKPAEISAGSRLSFRVLDPITITEHLN